MDSLVLLPRILGCWGSFARAFLPGTGGIIVSVKNEKKKKRKKRKKRKEKIRKKGGRRDLNSK